MAAEGDATKDFKAHESTYAGFTTLMKWGTILSAIAAILVIIVIQ